jgi:ankyrin repeat protein
MSFKCLIGLHSWNGCKCSACGKIQDKFHTWNGFKCSTCNQYNSKLATSSLVELSIKGEAKKVKEAIEAKADLQTKDSNGFTAYLQAASMGHIEIVKLFIEAGISVNQKYVGNNNKTITLLHVASYCGRIEMVEYLLSIGAEVDIKDEFNDTPLFNAVVNKKTEVVKVLLRNGAYPHSQCRKNFTPYQYAVEAKLYDIIPIFEDHFNNHQTQITNHSQIGKHPKLNPDYCPICGRMMIENSHNLEILSAMGFSECNTCGISYASLTGHQTSNMTAVEKCREIGYKVSIQPGGYGVYSIRD